MILRQRRNGIYNNVSIRISRLYSLYQLRIIIYKGLCVHPVVICTQHNYNSTGFHHGHGIYHGIKCIRVFKCDKRFGNRTLNADSFLCTKLLQRNKTIIIVTHRVGIAQKERFVEIFFSSIFCFGQNRSGCGIYLIIVCKIGSFLHLAHRG